LSISKSEAVRNYLQASTHRDLASLYNLHMECQVNVVRGEGEITTGEFQGKKWKGFTDGLTVWKPFRIPYNAATNPEYTDSNISFDIAEHCDGIGMTGWDWYNKCSKWVAFDFDAITGHAESHSKKLSSDDLQRVSDAACSVDWVTVRKSTSGNGLHLYIFLDDVKTNNHTEHAALARSILGLLSGLTGFDFESKVDICGGNMWVWHSKMKGTSGLELIKQGCKLTNIPDNWYEHVKVISRRPSKRNRDVSATDPVVSLAGQQVGVTLDTHHRALINYLQEQDAHWWWDQDKHMLVTHTSWLKKAHTDLDLRGLFETTSKGSDLDTHNCFAFPVRDGAWAVRRYTPGVTEHPSWEQDNAGWTRCHLNREPSLRSVSSAFNGVEDEKCNFIFNVVSDAVSACRYLGVNLEIPAGMKDREVTLSEHRDGRLVVKLEQKSNDAPLPGWHAKKGKPWTKLFGMSRNNVQEPDLENHDNLVRHVVSENSINRGWAFNSDSQWRDEPLTHIRAALSSMGLVAKESDSVVGSLVHRPWTLVNRPFQPEYPGTRQWNRQGAQLKFAPSPPDEGLNYKHWTMILDHCGSMLTPYVVDHPWCKYNGILTGSDYLKYWVAALFQRPTEPLPYLAFYGEQNSGKSVFHESLALLFTHGYKHANIAITSTGNFNAELEGAVLCAIEEINLKQNIVAYNRIKDWVTSRQIVIHPKNETPYMMLNTTHWVQCTNDITALPVFPGDSRITVVHVPELPEHVRIPRRVLIPLLEKEASDFLGMLYNLEIPEGSDRLLVPVIETLDKQELQRSTFNTLEAFIDEKLVKEDGSRLPLSEIYDAFESSLQIGEAGWSRRKVSSELSLLFEKGRNSADGQIYIGNVNWVGKEEQNPGKRWTLSNGQLCLVEGK